MHYKKTSKDVTAERKRNTHHGFQNWKTNHPIAGESGIYYREEWGALVPRNWPSCLLTGGGPDTSIPLSTTMKFSLTSLIIACRRRRRRIRGFQMLALLSAASNVQEEVK